MLEEDEDDTIHMGNAIMTFYAALIDLLGRCAPEMHVSGDPHRHTQVHTVMNGDCFLSVDSCW